jgi:hypothetical protein
MIKGVVAAKYESFRDELSQLIATNVDPDNYSITGVENSSLVDSIMEKVFAYWPPYDEEMAMRRTCEEELADV